MPDLTKKRPAFIGGAYSFGCDKLTPKQQETYDLKQQGMTVPEIAEKLGETVECIKSRWKLAKRFADADPSAQMAASSAGAATLPHSYWIKSDGVSAYFKTEQAEDKRDLLADVAAAFDNIPAYVPQTMQADHNELLAVYPLYDLHAGLLAYGRETRGPDFDLDWFARDLTSAIERLNSRLPQTGHALVIIGGDAIHTNDASELTPGHKHKLDTDGRFEKIADVAIASVAHSIESIAARHARVSVVVIRGNHDEGSHLILKAALKQRYRDVDRIDFPVIHGADKSEIFWIQHGLVMIAAHHGDKMKPETLAMICADQCRFWSDTRHRVILTGHRHHLRVLDMPGVTHYTMRAFAPADAYGASFGGVRGLQAMVFDSKHGLIAQLHDGVWRDDE